MQECIVFAGGGTGGHVYPGLAVIKVLEERRHGKILWIGSTSGMEKALVEKSGIPFVGIPSGKLRRYFSPRNVMDVFKIAAGVLVSLALYLRRRPRLVFSKGGYVSVPPVFAAWLLRIPVYTHESDLDPGLATRLNAPFVKKILVPYEESTAFFPVRLRSRLVVTGNPVRPDIRSGDAGKGRSLFPFSERKPLLLVLGGSQGAKEINDLTAAALDRLLDLCNIVHQVGPAADLPPPKNGYVAVRYLSEEYPHVLAAADVVMSRAGAGALWEIATAGKPAILVPLREGSRGDQVRNAELFVRRKLAVVVDRPDAEGLLIHVREALARAGEVRELSSWFRQIDAAKTIADMILEEVGS